MYSSDREVDLFCSRCRIWMVFEWLSKAWWEVEIVVAASFFVKRGLGDSSWAAGDLFA